ncbi:MSMEG_0565 family glycosyltransferase [Kineosporia mesophila]|uniref:MSMEG_0565 family glycosyltransferase n=1 Tax=Kineosporia mesophila TaxID=566012 RepID=A0ABP7AF60_9ACTN|nr:MSMEG_0565 family glycosyltransferase [Kineosporia mesophila]MCD5352901.1 MSMEG_0565 family glycosyltransferase [Kineosporia mesophila]
MRISLLTYSTKPRGGVVHTLALAEALARAGQDVTVWTLARGGDQAFFRTVDPAVTVRAVPFPSVDGQTVGQRVLRSIDALRRAFEGSYDVIHAQDCISANAVPGKVRTVHHLDHFTTAELAACHERAIVQPAAHVCVSSAVAGELYDGWGLRATVIPNGVDAARFATAVPDCSWREKYGDFVLAVGGIEPRKGTIDLVRAMGIVQAVRPGVRLLVAGGETLFDYRDYRSTVDREAWRLGVKFTVLGTVAEDDLPGLVASSAAFAFPSTAEGFGLAAMEALAARRPVIVRDLPVLREVFGDCVRFAASPATLATGLLADLSGEVDPARRERGSALAASHSWDDAAAAHLSLYRRLLDEGAPVGSEASGPGRPVGRSIRDTEPSAQSR